MVLQWFLVFSLAKDITHTGCLKPLQSSCLPQISEYNRILIPSPWCLLRSTRQGKHGEDFLMGQTYCLYTGFAVAGWCKAYTKAAGVTECSFVQHRRSWWPRGISALCHHGSICCTASQPQPEPLTEPQQQQPRHIWDPHLAWWWSSLHHWQ